MKNTRPYYLDLQLFAEEQKLEQPQPEVDPNKNAIQAFKELKENSVPKSAYEALEKQNKELFDTVINGGSIKEASPQDTTSIKQLREELFKVDSGLTNLQYWEKALLLRKKLMEQGETDPFVPVGKKIVAEQSDLEAAQRVADVVQECIDYAEGDSIVFTNELQRRTIDTSIKPTSRR